MADNNEKPGGNSRRQVLKLGAYALGSVGAISFTDGANAQVAKKAAQKSVLYQQTPKNGQYCSICQQFIPPSACKVVDGEINPNGYCILFHIIGLLGMPRGGLEIQAPHKRYRGSDSARSSHVWRRPKPFPRASLDNKRLQKQFFDLSSSQLD